MPLTNLAIRDCVAESFAKLGAFSVSPAAASEDAIIAHVPSLSAQCIQ